MFILSFGIHYKLIFKIDPTQNQGEGTFSFQVQTETKSLSLLVLKNLGIESILTSKK